MAETKTQDAIALLKEDHRTVEKLFKDFESAKGDGRKEKLARQICLELTVHTKIAGHVAPSVDVIARGLIVSRSERRRSISAT